MPSEAELLRAIIANPERDGPRRAYATAARGRGDDRGDFIDLQLELAAVHRRNGRTSEWSPLERRVQKILASSSALWLEPLAKFLRDDAKEPVFIRGFVEHISIDARRFADVAPALYAATPILHLSLTGVGSFPEILGSALLARLVSLNLSMEHIGDAGIQWLASSPHVQRLRWLDLSSNRITEAGLETLCASEHLKGLRYVNFTGNKATNPVDDFGSEGESIIHTGPRAEGIALEHRFGRIPWLHAPDEFGDAYPPARECVEPE